MQVWKRLPLCQCRYLVFTLCSKLFARWRLFYTTFASDINKTSMQFPITSCNIWNLFLKKFMLLCANVSLFEILSMISCKSLKLCVKRLGLGSELGSELWSKKVRIWVSTILDFRTRYFTLSREITIKKFLSKTTAYLPWPFKIFDFLNKTNS